VTALTSTTAPALPPDERLDAERARELGVELGLTLDEVDRIVATLGRVPSVSELGMYSVMWSEHCSYKSSRIHLRHLPTDGPQVLVGPGENAGVVDVGDGLAVTFKIESHNHPSFVEPFQGAATGVGGILRDILTMGARPIAIMDPLRFGDPGGWVDGTGERRPVDHQQRHLIDGVVRGVGGYGNCVGVPNIGGETVFDDGYAGNPLVNVLAIGVLAHDRLQRARAERPGDLAVLVGSSTGRDGIGGASVLASQQFDEGLDAKRPNVQVGDPFAEKLLIECCLELYDRGLVRGIQDMGAAGIACSTSELASAASMGMRVDLDRVHLRQPGMASWEILCSESQERMLVLVDPERLDELLEVTARWGVDASVVGEVTDGDRLVIERDGAVVADAPARSLADEGPVLDRPYARPASADALAEVDAETLDVVAVARKRRIGLDELLLDLVASPNLASKRWVHEQYDHLVLGGTVLGPGDAGAGVVRLPGTERAVACATVGNGRWCELDPREGTRRVVATAVRRVAAAGARPLAATNCLNLGDPGREDVMWQLVEVIGGLGEACAALDVPVTGGNVSLYNETRGVAIPPTPVVGILGLMDAADHAVGTAFEDDGDTILLVGAPTVPGLAASEFQRFLAAPLGGALAPVDLAHEARLAAGLASAAAAGLVASAREVSRGGLLAALVDAATGGDVGAAIDLARAGAVTLGLTQTLLSESPGRAIVTVNPVREAALVAHLEAAGLAVVEIGGVGGDALVLERLGPDLEGDDAAAGLGIEDGALVLGLDRLVEAREATLPGLVG
jgi:phosphoribosylformylglycinamidine synthase II